MRGSKWTRLGKRLALDVALAGVCLCVFALFHHVLPRSGGEPLTVIDGTADVTVEPTATITEKSYASSRPGKSGKGQSGGASGKGGSALENVDTETVASEAVDLAARWAERFSDTVIATATSYASPDLSIDLQSYSEDGVDYYIADICLSDATCLQTALAQNAYGTGYRDSIPDMAAAAGALAAINGDYYGNTNEGVVIRNGVVYRANATECDVCVLYRDGTMRTLAGGSFDLDSAVADGAWQAWTFGPALLGADGSAIAEFSSTRHVTAANPRTAIGYYEPGHYCFVTVDGRGDSAGLTLSQLSALFERLGCAAAYNLDGGNSSVMVFGGEVVNQPSGGGRESSDCILVKEADAT